ncbi:MAG: hypothetical protein WCF03_06885 [Nitrososphaeraceae archaeon]
MFSVLKLQAQSAAAPKLKSGSTLFSAAEAYKEFFDVPITVEGIMITDKMVKVARSKVG